MKPESDIVSFAICPKNKFIVLQSRKQSAPSELIILKLKLNIIEVIHRENITGICENYFKEIRVFENFNGILGIVCFESISSVNNIMLFSYDTKSGDFLYHAESLIQVRNSFICKVQELGKGKFVLMEKNKGVLFYDVETFQNQ